MKQPFEEIRITDLDVDLTQQSDEATGFLRLYLKLSGEPSPEWVKIFEQERRFPPHRTWRNAWVIGRHIVVECVPEELEQFQLNHLKEDVTNANRKFSEWATRNNEETLRHLQKQVVARERLEKLRSKLRFDRTG
jgi:hypothetical protein